MSLLNSEPSVVYLARQQKTLDDYSMPLMLKWFLRWIYNHYGFAGTGCKCGELCSFEDRGVFLAESDARWAANCKGGSYKAIPLNNALPEETVKFGVHDFPQSDASPMYRRRRLPYTAIPTEHLRRLRHTIR